MDLYPSWWHSLYLLLYRWDLAEMKVTKDDENSPAGAATMDYALAFSRNVFEAQVRSRA